MRTDKELMIALKGAIESSDNLTGICVQVNLWHFLALECKRVFRLLDKYKPIIRSVASYWWTPGRLKPRVKFLNKVIKKLN